ncbi:MAG: hypothetical protein CSH37_13480 [Thalassolituus sp.]|nr:MAG: hypothetical protein CSH37_13480 [Thalassolituus sp.]
MQGPRVGGVSTCPSCKSRIEASYKKLSLNYYLASMVGVISLMTASVLIFKYSGLTQEVFAALFIFLSLVYSLSLNKILTGRFFANPRMVIEYELCSGISYQEEIQSRRELLATWLENADTDFIGFIRYLFNTDYVWESLDDQSQSILMHVHANADNLPDQQQLSDSNPVTLSGDLNCVEALKAEYLPMLRPIVKNLKDSPLEYRA